MSDSASASGGPTGVATATASAQAIQWHSVVPTARLWRSLALGGTLLLGLHWTPLSQRQQFGLMAALLGVLMGRLAWDAWRSLAAARKAQFTLQRLMPRAFAHGAPHRISLVAQHQDSRAWQVQVHDGTDGSLEVDGLPLHAELLPQHQGQWRYRVVPQRRGPIDFEPAWLRALSLGGWWWLQGRGAGTHTAQVLPNFAEVAKYAWLATDRRLAEMGIKQYVGRGQGTDFRQLVDYTRGDPIRHVDWKASLRRGKPVVRQYQDERDQTVMVMLDCGRRMRALEPGARGSHFDQVLNATLLMSWVALKEGDQVGVMSFGHAEHQGRHVAPRKGLTHLQQMMAHLHDLEPSEQATDYLAAAKALMAHQPRRALVIMVTDFRDEDLPDLEPALRLMRNKHLVLLASLRERVTDQVATQTMRDGSHAAEVAAAHWQAQARAQAFAHLAAHDHHMVDALPEHLAVALVNRYHAVKRSHRL